MSHLVAAVTQVSVADMVTAFLLPENRFALTSSAGTRH